jgi:hypothetical protein
MGAMAVAIVAASSSACLSPVPLDPEPKADIDHRLLGAWRCLPPEAAAGDEPADLTVARLRERVYGVEFGEAGKEPDRYEAHASTVAGRTVVNVRDVSAKDKPWDFVAYELLRPGVLVVTMVSEDAVKGLELTPAALRARIAQPGAFADFAVCVPRRKE